MKSRIIQIVALTSFAATTATQCMLPNKIKNIAYTTAKRVGPNLGAALIAVPILVCAQKYLGMTYTINPRNDKNSIKNESVKCLNPRNIKQS
jgi:hypothetical protein